MKQTEHLKMEVLEEFIERGLEGCVSCPVERHLAGCPECVERLERLLQDRFRPGSAGESVRPLGTTSRA